MLDTFSANTEISKRRSWESSRSVLSSQPEEVEHDENTEVWQSNSGLNHSEPRAGEPAASAPTGHGKPKEGYSLVRKLKQFRKGTLFVFIHLVYTENIYMYMLLKLIFCHKFQIITLQFIFHSVCYIADCQYRLTIC
jgi:hypothetical protein